MSEYLYSTSCSVCSLLAHWQSGSCTLFAVCIHIHISILMGGVETCEILGYKHFASSDGLFIIFKLDSHIKLFYPTSTKVNEVALLEIVPLVEVTANAGVFVVAEPKFTPLM